VLDVTAPGTIASSRATPVHLTREEYGDWGIDKVQRDFIEPVFAPLNTIIEDEFRKLNC